MSKLDLARTLFLYLSKKICNIYVKNIMLMFNFRHFRHIFCTFRHIFLPKSAILIKLMLNLDIYFSILQHIYSRICQGYSGVYTEVYRGIQRRYTENGIHRGMTPQTTPRYARGYIYSLWGSLGYPKTEQKPNIPKIFTVVKTTTYIFTPVFSLFLAHFLKKPLHIF